MTGRFTGSFSVADHDSMSCETENLNKVESHRSSMLHRKDQYKEIATDLFDGGMVRQKIGGFHPANFFFGLLKCAEKAAAIILSHTAVMEKKIYRTVRNQLRRIKVK